MKVTGFLLGPDEVESDSALLSFRISLHMHVCQYTHTHTPYQLLSYLHHCELGIFYNSVVSLFKIQT